jgi:hypothetical protein
MTPEEDSAEPMPPDEDWKIECEGQPHDWQPINTPRGLACQLRLMTPEEVAAMDSAEPMPPDEDWDRTD